MEPEIFAFIFLYNGERFLLYTPPEIGVSASAKESKIESLTNSPISSSAVFLSAILLSFLLRLIVLLTSFSDIGIHSTYKSVDFVLLLLPDLF